jgi:CRP/FNR family transcriptional regulator, cyclic AMP receptor protein
MLDLDFLKKFPIFSGLQDDKLEKIKNIITLTECSAGAIVIKDGDRGEEMFILLEGDVEISKQMTMSMPTDVAAAGKDKSLIRLSSKFHACFGEMALFEENSERSATVTAVTDCKLAIITRVSFTKLIDDDNQIGYIVFKNLARIISDRLRRANKDILKLTTAFVLAIQK